jgi:nitrate reductase gamma subunit
MIYDIYAFLAGPMVWIAGLIFVIGSIYRIASMLRLARRKDPMVYEYFNFYYALRSIVHWIIPFAGANMRRHPAMTLISFIFHICLMVLPVFLFAHVILIKESWNIAWWVLPDAAADVMTIIVLFCCIFFALRRIMLPEVRYLTTFTDYLTLLMVAAPFATGFWAYHQLAGHEWALILHMLSGEILIAAIPFTKLSHMLFFPFIRGYAGSEFGAVRHARDW